MRLLYLHTIIIFAKAWTREKFKIKYFFNSCQAIGININSKTLIKYYQKHYLKNYRDCYVKLTRFKDVYYTYFLTIRKNDEKSYNNICFIVFLEVL